MGGGSVRAPLQVTIKIVCIWFTCSPEPWKWRGCPLGPKASCPSQALRAQGTGGGAGCTALCWGRKREWGGGRPQPAEARRVQGVWGGREVTALRALRPCWPLGAGPAPGPRNGPRGP